MFELQVTLALSLEAASRSPCSSPCRCGLQCCSSDWERWSQRAAGFPWGLPSSSSCFSAAEDLRVTPRDDSWPLSRGLRDDRAERFHCREPGGSAAIMNFQLIMAIAVLLISGANVFDCTSRKNSCLLYFPKARWLRFGLIVLSVGSVIAAALFLAGLVPPFAFLVILFALTVTYEIYSIWRRH